LGIFLCILCAGIHRSLGSHISKVKSVTLDDWSLSQTVNAERVGNEKSNAHFLAHSLRKYPENLADTTLMLWIRAKYEMRLFQSTSSHIVSELDRLPSVRSLISFSALWCGPSSYPRVKFVG
jgi:hypothetical protein